MQTGKETIFFHMTLSTVEGIKIVIVLNSGETQVAQVHSIQRIGLHEYSNA